MSKLLSLWRSVMFLCRDIELAKLSKRYQDDGLECIIIYGRRRVGKTALINEFCRGKKTILFPALKATAQDNLKALSKSIHLYLYPDADPDASPVFASYDAAFSEITRIANAERGERIIFVIDELPYLVEADGSIPSRLQHLLDHDWSATNLFIILCGSSMSFMEKEILSKKSPLFGRRTAQFKLEALTYLDAARFHPECTPQDNAMIYAITGGIPHYINKLSYRGNLRNALIENFFDTSSYLFEEPQNLLKQELREPAVYNSIITAIADGRTRLSDIADAAHIPSSAGVKYIKTLSELGIVRKTEPVVDKSKRKVQYLIADQFFRFWYRFVPRNMMSITSGTISRSFDAAIGSYLNQYMGLSFEEICQQYLIHYATDLPIVISDIGNWWGTHPQRHEAVQLDIVATSAKADNTAPGREFIIGSCKYTNSPVGEDELALIRDYASAFTDARDTCFYYIFSKSGFTSSLKDLANAGAVTLVSLEDIYRESLK